MIKEIKALLKKYTSLQGRTEYVSTHEVSDDLYQLLRDCRLKRIPKDQQ